jgi:hypothetical protein
VTVSEAWKNATQMWHAVKRYNCMIDNVASFAKYGNDAGGKLTYKVIMSDEYKAAKNEINEMSARVIAGC